MVSSATKRRLLAAAIPALRALGGLLFDRQYLRGRHFEASDMGWRWLWRGAVWQRVFGFNRHVPWPVSPFVLINTPANLVFDPDDLQNFQVPGVYFQNSYARIVIGKGTYIAPGVGLITANHDPRDLDRHLPGREIVLGEACWIGMNAVILPGVMLGPRTVVGAGAVVARSFPDGHCVIAGVPARLVRRLPP